MAFINDRSKEINFKILYFGPPHSGKTTTFRNIYQQVKEKGADDFLSVASGEDSSLYFDFLPIDLGEFKKYRIRLHLYAVPGALSYPVARKIVSKGVDGVVFLADSAPQKLEANKKSWEELKQLLKEEGEDLQTVPLVIQYNKRDHPQALPVEDLRRFLNSRKVPDFETVATKGVGVFEALKNIGKLVVKSLQQKSAA